MKIKRVLLIAPPVTRPSDMLSDVVRIGIVPPLGLAYIAAVLEKEGIEVKILDCVVEGQQVGLSYNGMMRYGLTDEGIEYGITKFKPQLVGVSCLTSNMAWDAHNVCRIVKKYNKDVITVMGGTHPTVRADETLRDKNITAIITGEGEHSILRFIDIVNMGWDVGRIFSSYPLENLDTLPFPARHLLPMDKYMNTNSPHSGVKRKPFTSMITSRGCPARCAFCTIREMWGTKCRQRSPKNVLSEIEHLVNTYRIKELHFEDDNLTFNKKRAMAIFQGIIDHKWDLSLNSPSGLALFALDEELLEKMAEAGYYSISLPIESGDPSVLKNLMHKNVDLAKAKRLVKKSRELGMKVKGFFILGYPGETKDSMKRTVDFAGSIGLDWAIFFIATPLPGTEMEVVCRKNNWLVNPDLDFMHSFYIPNIRTPEFDPDYVLQLKEQANTQINFKNNYNLKVGNYDKAIADFQEVANMYPGLKIAQDALAEAKCKQQKG